MPYFGDAGGSQGYLTATTAEYMYHHANATPTIPEVCYPGGNGLFISHLLDSYSFGNLPFTSDAIL